MMVDDSDSDSTQPSSDEVCPIELQDSQTNSPPSWFDPDNYDPLSFLVSWIHDTEEPLAGMGERCYRGQLVHPADEQLSNVAAEVRPSEPSVGSEAYSGCERPIEAISDSEAYRACEAQLIQIRQKRDINAADLMECPIYTSNSAEDVSLTKLEGGSPLNEIYISSLASQLEETHKWIKYLDEENRILSSKEQEVIFTHKSSRRYSYRKGCSSSIFASENEETFKGGRGRAVQNLARKMITRSSGSSNNIKGYGQSYVPLTRGCWIHGKYLKTWDINGLGGFLLKRYAPPCCSFRCFTPSDVAILLGAHEKLRYGIPGTIRKIFDSHGFMWIMDVECEGEVQRK